MSFRTYVIYGLGVCSDQAPQVTREGVEALLAMAPETAKYVRSHPEYSESDDHFANLDWYEADSCCVNGAFALLSDVLAEREHMIYFTLCDDFDGLQYILYEPCYPWEVSVRDMSMTPTSIREIFDKYTMVLYGMTLPVVYYECHNGG